MMAGAQGAATAASAQGAAGAQEAARAGAATAAGTASAQGAAGAQEAAGAGAATAAGATSAPQPCRTRYPLLLVHGIGLSHRRHFWGRIPPALQAAGAPVHLAHTDAWGTVEHNATLLKQQLEQLLASTGAERVNIIAHSKGGLEARCLAESLGCAHRIASITTLSTPHAGAKTMDVLLRWFRWAVVLVAPAFNAFMRLRGEHASNFAAACAQLSTDAMRAFNHANLPAPTVYYQSYASVMPRASSDYALGFSYLLIKPFDGENDGLISAASAPYGEFKGMVSSATRVGISHRDMIDLRMKPFAGKVVNQEGVADIVDWHIALVTDLKQRGF